MAVLAADEYWQESDGDERARAALACQLKRVKQFLQQHQSHRLGFGDFHRFHRPEDEWLEWLCEDEGTDLLPRHSVEVLGYGAWSEVERHVASLRIAPWWWTPANRAAARRRFEELTQGVRHDRSTT